MELLLSGGILGSMAEEREVPTPITWDPVEYRPVMRGHTLNCAMRESHLTGHAACSCDCHDYWAEQHETFA